jgi:hypothetical protein
MPALSLRGSNRLVHIVQISQSWKAPHAVADGDGWIFPKRTNNGTEPMSYSEVQAMFLGYYEKRLKLQLLRAELAQLSRAQTQIGLTESENRIYFSHLPTFELRVLETVLSDTYSVTHHYPSFVGNLEELRTKVRSLNSITETLRWAIAVYPDDGRRRIETYGSEIEKLANGAITEVDKIVGEGQRRSA